MSHQKQWPKPHLGISSCLLGNRVRHNGEHKKNDWLFDHLGPYVTWTPICPEVEMGLSVPRDTMRLTGTLEEPRLIAFKTKEDLTEKAQSTFDRILKKDYDFDGYVFKKDSPTCGLERVKVYLKTGIPAKSGVGLFAQRVKERYPETPMIEEGRLSDLEQREAFLIRLFSWAELRRTPKKISALQLFHQNHKLQLMAYDPQAYQKLGKLAANSNQQSITTVFDAYQKNLAQILTQPLTASKNINAFQHILGYFKKDLSASEKSYILNLFTQYRRGKVPLVAISSLFGFLIERYSVDYLKTQSILEPYPNGILLGKH